MLVDAGLISMETLSGAHDEVIQLGQELPLNRLALLFLPIEVLSELLFN